MPTDMSIPSGQPPQMPSMAVVVGAFCLLLLFFGLLQW